MVHREVELYSLVLLRPHRAAEEVRSALESTSWSIEDAAILLDISAPTLYRLAARLVHHGHGLIEEARWRRGCLQRMRVYDRWVTGQQVA